MNFNKIGLILFASFYSIIFLGIFTILFMDAFGYDFPGDIDRDEFCIENGYDTAVEDFFTGNKCEKVINSTIITNKFIMRGTEYFFINPSDVLTGESE